MLGPWCLSSAYLQYDGFSELLGHVESENDERGGRGGFTGRVRGERRTYGGFRVSLAR